MQLIKNPWESLLLENVAKCHNQIRIVSPFVKASSVQKLLDAKKNSTSLDFITSIKLVNFIGGASDVEALALMQRKTIHLYHHQKVHAKVYIFDEYGAVVTSGNMTNGGLLNNYEYGVFIDEKSLLREAIQDFDTLKIDPLTSVFGEHEVTSLQTLLNNLPTEKIETPEWEYAESNKLSTPIDTVIYNLTGWQQSVMQKINLMPQTVFTLTEFKTQHLNSIAKEFPKAKTPDATLRRVLQELRDLGLIQFLNNTGTYKKLW